MEEPYGKDGPSCIDQILKDAEYLVGTASLKTPAVD